MLENVIFHDSDVINSDDWRSVFGIRVKEGMNLDNQDELVELFTSLIWHARTDANKIIEDLSTMGDYDTESRALYNYILAEKMSAYLRYTDSIMHEENNIKVKFDLYYGCAFKDNGVYYDDFLNFVDNFKTDELFESVDLNNHDIRWSLQSISPKYDTLLKATCLLFTL